VSRLVANLLALFAALFALGCGNLPAKTPLQPPPYTGESPGSFVVGTALVDITPPLHLSLYGHGPESRVATGVRLRLHCQVFVVSTGVEPIALVPCDLQSSSAALQRGVAALLADYGIPITADRIFIMATHTHAGPAHYFEARFYSGPFSSSIPSYDEEVKNFLARAVAEGIVRAFAAQAPACVGWSEVNVPDLSFNRSYVPFLANEGLDASVTPVDQRLFVLRFDPRQPGARTCVADGPPLGVLAVYGMHPTGISHANELYHGDIFGFATRVATACLRNAKRDPINPSSALAVHDEDCDAEVGALDAGVLVGLANGIEGDVSPNVRFQSVPNARALGRRLGVEIAHAAAAIPTLDATGPFEHAYWELWFPSGRYDEAGHQLCPFGDLGVAAGGGAPDGPTRLRVLDAANPGYRLKLPAGMTEAERPCQGPKLGLRIGTTPDPLAFPQFGAISLIQVGPARFATAPAELTTMTGHRIRQVLEKRLGAERIAVVGLTNHYFQYVTTKEEYEYQYYEGASNLYGPHTAEFLAHHFDCLADWLNRKRGVAENVAAGATPAPRCSQPLAVNRLYRFEPHPKPQSSRMPEEEDGLSPLLLKAPGVSLSFEDGAPGWEMEFPRLPLTFSADHAKYRVVVLSWPSRAVVDDDDGSSLETSEASGGATWRVRWAPDLEARRAALCDQPFVLAVRGRFEFESRPFKLDCSFGKAKKQ
jgi:neutral ceramidase